MAKVKFVIHCETAYSIEYQLVSTVNEDVRAGYATTYKDNGEFTHDETTLYLYDAEGSAVKVIEGMPFAVVEKTIETVEHFYCCSNGQEIE